MFGVNKYPNPRQKLIEQRRATEAKYEKIEEGIKDYERVKGNVLHWAKQNVKYTDENAHLRKQARRPMAEKKALEKKEQMQKLREARLEREKLDTYVTGKITEKC